MTIRNLETHAVIKWRITELCNFRCPYCIRRPIANEEYEWDIMKTVKQINKFSKQFDKPVKVDLIGGEVTVLPNLKEVIDNLDVDKVNITTNFELDPPEGSKITATLSYHPSQTKYTIEEWFERASYYRNKIRYCKVETVKTEDATHIDRFIELATAYSLDYQVEEDLLNSNLKGEKISTMKSNPRYEVTFDDGHKELFATRNSFLKKYGFQGLAVSTENKLCTRDVDYIYIEKDMVWSCDKKYPINEFKLRKPHPCLRSKGYCTLCGNISLI